MSSNKHRKVISVNPTTLCLPDASVIVEYPQPKRQCFRREDVTIIPPLRRQTQHQKELQECGVLPIRSQYYFTDGACQAGDDLRQIVSDAFTHTHNIEPLSDCTAEESHLHLLLLQLLKSMSSPHQAILVEILLLIQKNPDVCTTTRIPTNINDINRFYMNGKLSLSNSIPHAKVNVHDDHAYVKLYDVIAHLVAHGIEFDSLSLAQSEVSSMASVLTISDSEAAKEIVTNISNNIAPDVRPLILHISLWSDDFEVTYVKSTNSVWVHTVTVCPPKGQNSSARYTHTLALGRKGNDHESILALFHSELKQLANINMMFSGKHKCTIPVIVKLLTIIADRPERSSINCILSHAGNSTTRWRYSAFIDPDRLRSCRTCFTRRLI